ncbi:MAG: hypothetical protein QOE01_1029 [Actinomycetota bacterium]|jgi:hypothetical protein|nr:hypothetical protein [Actinomycetota bacterium]
MGRPGRRIHTLHRATEWVNVLEGNTRALSRAPYKAEAVAEGRRLAEARGLEHVIHTRDGDIMSRKTYVG